MSARDDLRNILELTDCSRGQWEPLLDELIAERDRWASKAAANLRGWNEATNRAQAWEEALHRWGRHEEDCTALNPGGRCSCGLTPFAWPEDSDADYRRDRNDKLAADAREAYIAERESETTS